MAGRIGGIARRKKSRAPMEELSQVVLSPGFGVDGDSKGAKFPKRQVTLLSRELWDAACFTLGNPELHWTARRANLLVEGQYLPRGIGSLIRVGPALLEVTAETTPCARMDEIWPGLRRALAADWRGGVTTRVVRGGTVALGDAVTVERDITPHKVHLPG